jgi:hypothetical protein
MMHLRCAVAVVLLAAAVDFRAVAAQTGPDCSGGDDSPWCASGLYPIVPSQHSSTTVYTSFPIML